MCFQDRMTSSGQCKGPRQLYHSQNLQEAYPWPKNYHLWYSSLLVFYTLSGLNFKFGRVFLCLNSQRTLIATNFCIKQNKIVKISEMIILTPQRCACLCADLTFLRDTLFDFEPDKRELILRAPFPIWSQPSYRSQVEKVQQTFSWLSRFNNFYHFFELQKRQ